MRIVTENHGWWLDNSGRRHTEWSAIDDDTYDGAEDSRSPMGRGATEEEAVADLMDLIADREASNAFR